MKPLLNTLDGALKLSFAALLIQLFRASLDAALVLPAGFPGSIVPGALTYTAISGV